VEADDHCRHPLYLHIFNSIQLCFRSTGVWPVLPRIYFSPFLFCWWHVPTSLSLILCRFQNFLAR
jgi:hypothetical protein